MSMAVLLDGTWFKPVCSFTCIKYYWSLIFTVDKFSYFQEHATTTFLTIYVERKFVHVHILIKLLPFFFTGWSWWKFINYSLQYDFPKQEAVIQFVIEVIQAEAFNPRTLFLIGSYTIGNLSLSLRMLPTEGPSTI